MKEPQFSFSKYINTIKKNLLKIFPLINEDFVIHIITDEKEETIYSFDKEMITELGGLIIIGKDFEHLANSFTNDYPGKERSLLEIKEEETKSINLKNIGGQSNDYDLIIKGWVGIYRTTRGRKERYGDFPDNFISLLSNKKLGEYNILPIVGKNRLPEVYVVGQLHIDLFEETELPDMALSNRQGYKTDDIRYEKVIEYVGNTLLPEILAIRASYATYKNEAKDEEKLKKQEEGEQKLREMVDKYKKEASTNASTKIADEIQRENKIDKNKVEEIIKEEMNAFSSIVGIKKRIDVQKKKILISQIGDDKDVSDVIYNLLLFNRVSSEDIIYTNCEDAECRIPEDTSIFDYLRTFFIESYSTEKIYVIYVTSDDMAKSWGAVTEVGAGWITRSDHKVFNIDSHTPARPLDTDVEWQTTIRAKGGLSMTTVECDKFALKIESVCGKLGYNTRNHDANIDKIKQFSNELQSK